MVPIEGAVVPSGARDRDRTERGQGVVAINRQVSQMLVYVPLARREKRDHDPEERDEEDHERDLGIHGEARAAHDIRQALHGVLLATCAALMSRPSRWRYATSAMICLSCSPFGPPSPSTAFASESAWARAIAGARFTASPYGTPSIAMTSTRRWMPAKSSGSLSRCG